MSVCEDRGDNAEEDVATGTMYVSSSDLELMMDSSQPDDDTYRFISLQGHL
jgi:hypothetical protein